MGPLVLIFFVSPSVSLFPIFPKTAVFILVILYRLRVPYSQKVNEAIFTINELLHTFFLTMQ